MIAQVPVILDTDIGGDIDDTWALVMMLKSPELDVKLVATDTGNTTYRAKVVAKMLEVAKRTDIPIGVGIHISDDPGPQQPWVEDYDLSSYPGTVHQDGVDALIQGAPNGAYRVVALQPAPFPAAQGPGSQNDSAHAEV